MTYEDKAQSCAEEYGIIEYSVMGNKMIYYVSFLHERKTCKAVINLDTQRTESWIPLKRFYKAHTARVGGRYYSNYRY